jgi:hypothetical protein
MKKFVSSAIILPIALFSSVSFASPVEGNWLMQKGHTDGFQRAISIGGSSFRSLIATPDGYAYESGWWTENPGPNGKTQVFVTYGEEPPDSIYYVMNGADTADIWMTDEPERWGSMLRGNCDLTLQYRDWNDAPHEGCAWIHIKGWGYSGLDGECVYNDEWKDIDSTGPMECLIESPKELL